MARILLVEDSEQIRDFLSHRLTRRGHEVLLAQDGEDGVSHARSAQPGIILLNMNLPVIDGWTVARTIRTDQQSCTIPILALTALALSADQEKTLQAVCDEHHPKPINTIQLFAQIDQLLARSSALQATA